MLHFSENIPCDIAVAGLCNKDERTRIKDRMKDFVKVCLKMPGLFI